MDITRSLVAEAAVSIGEVILFKTGNTRDFLIVDLAMNDLIRPALYSAYHEIPGRSANRAIFSAKQGASLAWNLVTLWLF